MLPPVEGEGGPGRRLRSRPVPGLDEDVRQQGTRAQARRPDLRRPPQPRGRGGEVTPSPVGVGGRHQDGLEQVRDRPLAGVGGEQLLRAGDVRCRHRPAAVDVPDQGIDLVPVGAGQALDLRGDLRGGGRRHGRGGDARRARNVRGGLAWRGNGSGEGALLGGACLRGAPRPRHLAVVDAEAEQHAPPPPPPPTPCGCRRRRRRPPRPTRAGHGGRGPRRGARRALATITPQRGQAGVVTSRAPQRGQSIARIVPRAAGRARRLQSASHERDHAGSAGLGRRRPAPRGGLARPAGLPGHPALPRCRWSRPRIAWPR